MTTIMSNTRLPKPKPDLVFRILADGGLIFSPQLELYFSVNSVGARVWNLLPPATETMDEMVEILAKEYTDVSADVIRADVEELLVEFAGLGLIESAL